MYYIIQGILYTGYDRISHKELKLSKKTFQ